MNFNVNYEHSSLRIVKTVYSIYDLNQYVKQGHVVLIEDMHPKPDLYVKSKIYRNVENGEYRVAPSRNYVRQYGETVDLEKQVWEEIREIMTYARPRTLTHDWAAYVLPLDTDINEELYIEDLIEDVLVTEFWREKIYAEDGIARWDGSRLVFKRELFDSRECVIVG